MAAWKIEPNSIRSSSSDIRYYLRAANIRGVMLKSFRSGAIVSGAIVLSLLTVGGGVAAADPVNVPDVAQYVDTVDHWRLTASLTGVTINPVPNSAATAFSREGFISGLATETIEGSGSPPVDKGTLRLWVQFGCQIDCATAST